MKKGKTTEQFLELFREKVSREGASELLDALLDGTFFDDPASTKYHMAYPGGLCEHCLHVYHRLYMLCENESYFNDSFEMPSEESIAIVALLHDLCKAGCYHASGDKYKFEDPLPIGHGTKSVILVQMYMQLTDEEICAIVYHMGTWCASEKNEIGNISTVYKKYPLALFLHMADEMATFIDEK